MLTIIHGRLKNLNFKKARHVLKRLHTNSNLKRLRAFKYRWVFRCQRNEPVYSSPPRDCKPSS